MSEITVPEGLIALMVACMDKEIHLQIEYTHGRYISGEFFQLSEEEQEKHVQQGPKGWEIFVDGRSFKDDKTDEIILYPTIGEMVVAGIRLLGIAIKDKDERP